jgi:hypothetical protein
LIRADNTLHHGEDLIKNLNQSGLLDNVVAKHSATTSTAYAIGSVSGAGVAGYGVYSLIVVSGLPILPVVALVAGCVASVVAGKISLEHQEYRRRVRQCKYRDIKPHTRNLFINCMGMVDNECSGAGFGQF